MTIRFNCPNCGKLIAFADKHTGKRARCLSCGQHFIIPAGGDEKPRKVEPEPEEAGRPLPGFYRAVFVGSWKMFVNPKNATGLVFVIAAVCFKFFVGHADYSFELGAFRFQIPMGLLVRLAAWGCLFWYYMEIIHLTALDEEVLPDVEMGGLFGFIWSVVKSLSIFAFTLVLVELPCIVALVVTKGLGFDWPILTQALAMIGLFAFPMAILTFSIGCDIEFLLHPANIIRPVLKAFRPYLIVVVLFILTWWLQLQSLEYVDVSGAGKFFVFMHLAANIAVQVLALVTMRSIGLFYRHYCCHFPW